MAIKEISRRELEELVKARLALEGIDRTFDIHRLQQPDKNGCNWHLIPDTADGWKPADLILETSEDVLVSIHAELSRNYNVKLSGGPG